MPINVNDPEYVRAEEAFHNAQTVEEQLMALNKMISHAPKHKGAENLRQQLTTRRKKLEALLEKKKKKGKTTQTGIKKGELQAVIIGNTNSGKSSLLKLLTNAEPKISPTPFTTTKSIVGIMEYDSVQVQLIEIPAIDGKNFDKSLVHTADTTIILLNNFEEIEEIEKEAYMITGKKIYVLNKSDQLNENQKRKLNAKFQSKKYNYEIISCIPEWPNNNIDELKKKIISSFDMIRVFTKQPGKEKEKKPMIMKPNSTVKEAAEKILKGFSKRIKKVKIWGPSSKFGGQVVGLNHTLKDLDVVEFHTN